MQPTSLHPAHKFHNGQVRLQLLFPPMTNAQKSPSCLRCQSPRSQRHLPCVCSSQPPPFSTLPPSSMPPSTNEGPDLRRASLDSEASIFSHFSLTPESEATLRAWEQTMLSSPTATSSPSPSPSKLTKATDKLTSRRWVVFIGRNPGVYTSSYVLPFPDFNIH